MMLSLKTWMGIKYRAMYIHVGYCYYHAYVYHVLLSCYMFPICICKPLVVASST